MLRSAVLVGSLASVAFGAVANFCVEQPYRGMQEFRDFEPAMTRCAAHYPTQTITKMLPNTCLTTTSTVILGTSTVHATNHLPCPSAHLEVRDEDHLVKRDELDLEARAPKGPTKGGATGKGPKRGGPTGAGPKHGGATGWGPKHGGATGAGPSKGGPTGKGPTKGGETGKGPTKGGETGKGPTKGGATGWGPTNGGPTGSGPTRTRSLPSSEEPGPTHHKRDAAPTQAPQVKRAAKSSEWNQYYASLVECGYDCIQTACSCVASPRVVLQTPTPTCISTLTKQTIVHETKTIDVAPSQC